MTLGTHVTIVDPVNPEKLFLCLLGVLASDPAFVPAWESPTSDWAPRPGPLRCGRATYSHRRKGDIVYHRETGKPLWRETRNQYASTLGQGLAALVEVEYADDASLRWLADEDLDGSEGPYNEHLVSVSFDTGYAYRDANGARASDVHASLLCVVKQFLEREPPLVRWAWYDERRGTWHGPDEIHRLGDPTRPVIARLAASPNWRSPAG